MSSITDAFAAWFEQNLTGSSMSIEDFFATNDEENTEETNEETNETGDN